MRGGCARLLAWRSGRAEGLARLQAAAAAALAPPAPPAASRSPPRAPPASPRPARPAGEVHLETCVKDLRERFARCDLVVSPPLVAFRESVFCRPEAPPETAGRPVLAVEATTASGACTIRVQAVPLPAALATALDQNADLLRLGLAKGGGSGAADQQQQQQQQQQQRAGAAGADADVGGGTGAPGSDSLAALGERLRALAEASEQEGLLPLLQRTWLLGPKRVGPNLLLASAPGGSGDEAAAASLFSLPADKVVRLAKQQAGRGAALPTPAARHDTAAAEAAAEEAAEAEDAAAAAAALERHLAVPLGFPEAAQRLGLAAGSEGGGEGESAASHASAAVANLAGQLDRLDLGSAGGGGIGGTAAAAVAAAANDSSSGGGGGGGGGVTSSSGLGGSLEYLRYSVESGVAAGFQMAAAAGPLCDEPLWGVAFAVEAQLNLPPGAGSAGAGDHRGGSAAAAAASLARAEDVYGPFSGQVSSAARQAARRAVLEGDPRLVEALFLCEVRLGWLRWRFAARCAWRAAGLLAAVRHAAAPRLGGCVLPEAH